MGLQQQMHFYSTCRPYQPFRKKRCNPASVIVVILLRDFLCLLPSIERVGLLLISGAIPFYKTRSILPGLGNNPLSRKKVFFCFPHYFSFWCLEVFYLFSHHSELRCLQVFDCS